MSKKIPAAEFKTALKALNVILKKAKKPVIKIVGVTKEVVIDKFTNTVLDFIEKEKSDELPDEAIEVYNNYIATEDDDDDTPEEKPKTKGKTKTKTKKKEPAEKKPGIVMLSVKAYMEEGVTSGAKDIAEHIQENFPDRNIMKTVSHVWGVLKHIKPYSK